jgi:hypothetical protein
MIECALQWVQNNTMLEFDYTDENVISNLPANVRLFVLKYVEVMDASASVTSESIEGLSQSFAESDKSALLWDIARSLFGDDLNSEVKFIRIGGRGRR